MGKKRAAAADVGHSEGEFHARLAEAREQQAAVSEILRAIARSPSSLDSTFASIAESSARLCRADGCVIWLLKDDVLRYAYGWTPSGEVSEYLQNLKIGPGGYGPGRVLVEGRSISEVDVRANPAVDPQVKERLGTRSAVAVPLRSSDRLLGVIALARHRVEPFTSSEVTLVETFADQAAIAIENVRLFSETKAALEQQTATAEILRVIAASPTDVQPVLDAITRSAATFCAAEDATVGLLDGAIWSIRAHHGPVEIDHDYVQGRDGLRAGPVSDDFVSGHAMLARRTIHVTDLRTAEARARYPTALLASPTARAIVATPLLRDGEPIGALFLRRREPVPFTQHQIDLVEAFATQAVIAIENVRLFNEIQDKSAQLAAASQHKSEFLANMSHELRTPLNAIIGFSEVLADGMFGPLADKQREYLEDIRSSGQHLLSLINDVLDLSKVEAGRMELDLGEVSLASVVDEALLLVRERAGRHGITVAAEVPADLPPLTADARKLKQVLLNLVTNAVKFTPDGGWVGVTARQEGDDLVVAVRDTGVGIAPDDQARIFEEFRQAKRRDGSVEGTGLGLALTKRIVELHGGRISLESEIGKGSTFTVRMPLRPAPVAS